MPKGGGMERKEPGGRVASVQIEGIRGLSEQLYSSPSTTPVNLGLASAPKRILVVLPGYAADGGSYGIGSGSLVLRPLGILWRLLTTGGYRRYVREHRDFYANPRSLDYMAERVAELFSQALPQARLLLVSTGATSAPLGPLALLGDRLEPSLLATEGSVDDVVARALVSHGPFDAAVLGHHDALGLGLHAVEHHLLSSLPDNIFVINGRRRVYRLTREMRRQLMRRRFLAETRIAELAMSIVIRVPGII